MRQRPRALFLGISSVLVTAFTLLMAAPSSAAAGTTAVGAFVAMVDLPTYPCSGGGCGGSLTGVFSGTVTGTDPNSCTTTPPIHCNTYTITWPDPTQPLPASNLSGSFTYTEGCPLAQGGSAGGTFTISGGLVDDNGTVAHDGTLTGQFGEARTAVVLTVTLGTTAATGNGHTLGTQQLPVGVGAGAFVPFGVATCANTPPGTAEVAGTAFVPE
ncbi:MAG TPA: hypothetical protein VFC09_15760 [Candidatus Dormibacteraeota bacterium]|nr:hypothetical protein [Candidatus Dormibacteraeota bacterium]